jgi:hypothetical protein
MNQDKKRFKDDIEIAERNILIVSWLGVASALILIAYAILGI